MVSEIQAATTNAGNRAQGGLTPDLLTLSGLCLLQTIRMWNCRPISHVGLENADHDSTNLRGVALRSKTERKATGEFVYWRLALTKGLGF